MKLGANQKVSFNDIKHCINEMETDMDVDEE